MPTPQDAQKWYTADDPVHGFDHVMRVYRLAEKLARLEGADIEIVRAAALLHDTPDEMRHTASGETEIHLQTRSRAHHQEISARFAGQVLGEEGWAVSKIHAVQHCIRAHRFRDSEEVPSTIEAKVLFDADKLDAIGAIGAARAVAYAARAGQPIYAELSEQFRNKGEKTAGESHSACHEYFFKLSKIKPRLFTQSAIKIADGRDKFMKDFFECLAAEVKGER